MTADDGEILWFRGVDRRCESRGCLAKFPIISNAYRYLTDEGSVNLTLVETAQSKNLDGHSKRNLGHLV